MKVEFYTHNKCGKIWTWGWCDDCDEGFCCDCGEDTITAEGCGEPGCCSESLCTNPDCEKCW